jgi:hypothetical protein
MAIAAYFNPTKAMSKTAYDGVMKELDAAGASAPKGRTHHSTFGPDDALMVFDIWDSVEDFEAFGATLMPILAAAGVDAGEPTIMPNHNNVPP